MACTAASSCRPVKDSGKPSLFTGLDDQQNISLLRQLRPLHTHRLYLQAPGSLVALVRTQHSWDQAHSKAQHLFCPSIIEGQRSSAVREHQSKVPALAQALPQASHHQVNESKTCFSDVFVPYSHIVRACFSHLHRPYCSVARFLGAADELAYY